MHNSQAQASRDYAIRQRAMRNLYDEYGEGTGSIIDNQWSDPFQGVSRVWPLLSTATPNSQEGHSATTGLCFVIIKNQIDHPEVPAVMVRSLGPALQALVTISPASVLGKVRAVFGLNISETAEVFGITRQTAYQWMKLTDMEQVRAHENRDRLKQIFVAVQTWQSLPPLKGHWLYALLPTGNTVLDLLKTPQVDLDALQTAHQALSASTEDRHREEGARATQAAIALAHAFAGLGAGRKAQKE